MENKIPLIYNAKYLEISTFFHVFLSKMIKTNLPLVCPLCFFFRCFGRFMPSSLSQTS